MCRKNSIFFNLLFQIILFSTVSCLTGRNSINGTALLDQAIQAAGENIENTVKEGQRIALLNFNSPSEQFSDYVLEELSRHLVNGKKLVVVDRRELDLIRQEENFQLSGEVSDSSAQAIGQKLGAQLIVSGSLTFMGETYRLRIRVLNVETAVVEASPSFDLNPREEKIVFLLDRMSLISTVKTYNIGDTGPAGGIIFYDKGAVTNGWRYLEAAPRDFVSTQWGAYLSDIRGTSTDIGSGKVNTEHIVVELKRLGEMDRPAEICIMMEINGYKDWFLPSIDELDLMYTNLKQKNLGGFSNNWYWSSSADSLGGRLYTFTYAQDFSSGRHDRWDRLDGFSVRAVRAF